MKRFAWLGLVLLAGCVRSGPRVIPPSAEIVVDAPVTVVRTVLDQALSNLGLPLRPSAAEGQVETDYVDIASYRPGAAQYPLAERLVRFIVAAQPDPNGTGSMVAVRALYEPFRRGDDVGRRQERGVPRSHPAMSVVEDLVAEIRTLTEGG